MGSGKDFVVRGQQSSNWVSGISTRTIHQATTSSLSQTIWPRWASTQFLSLPIVQTLLPVTFGYSLSSEAVVMRQMRRWKRLWRRSLTPTQEEVHGALSKLSERYNKSIASGGDYLESDYSFMCVLSIKVPIRKMSGNLFNDPHIYIYISKVWGLIRQMRCIKKTERKIHIMRKDLWTN